MTARWEKLGLTPQAMADRVSENQRQIESWMGRYVDKVGESTPSSPALPSDYGRQDDLLIHVDVLQLTHLQVIHNFGNAAEHLALSSALAVDYFHGPWRDDTTVENEKCDRARCRQLVHWFDEFRMGMMSALLARRSDDVLRLAQFVDVDLPEEDGSWYRTKADNQAYVVLACFVRDDSLSGCAELIKMLRAVRNRRPKIILACLEAIAAKDAVVCSKELTHLLRMYRDTEFSPVGKRIVTSWDATILWNLAGWKGLTLAACADELMNFVITRESLGVDC